MVSGMDDNDKPEDTMIDILLAIKEELIAIKEELYETNEHLNDMPKNIR